MVSLVISATKRILKPFCFSIVLHSQWLSTSTVRTSFATFEGHKNWESCRLIAYNNTIISSYMGQYSNHFTIIDFVIQAVKVDME